ncbi:MAG TPA: PQQ-dependent sugar dehydrogenase, partial [Planctomycetota bacterium]|nr:PQQ-dependent sugar dehydrogenase [Planctomycetota bacterium]
MSSTCPIVGEGPDRARRLLLLALLAVLAALLLRRLPGAVERLLETPLPPPPAEVAGAVSLEVFVPRGKLREPVWLTSAPGDPKPRLFVVEKPGYVRIVEPDGAVRPRPFLDVHDRVSGASEQGLLGLAFHPKFAENGRFFVYFTDRRGDTRVIEAR